MPRAHRHFLPGHVWHITHRCHKKDFLLKFAIDRHHLRYWLFESRKRFGLSVLNYIITSNHIHLLVRDRGYGEISKSMQLISQVALHRNITAEKIATVLFGKIATMQLQWTRILIWHGAWCISI